MPKTTDDKPMSEWTEEERAEHAHSDDAPDEDDPGHVDPHDRGLSIGSRVAERDDERREEDDDGERGPEGEPIDGLEGQGKPVHEMDGGDSENAPATPADLGVPKPTDLAPDNIEATVDVNAAAVEELAKLRGVGESAAKRIIEHREEHGPFGSVDELVEVEGFERSRVAQLVTQGAYAGGGNGANGD